MRFLADESCDFAVVRALRAAGHDVRAVAEFIPRADDAHVVGLAIDEERILLTEDKDFGQLVFAHGHRTTGVVFLRISPPAREQIAQAVVQLAEQQGDRLRESFVVVQPGRIRISRAHGR